MDPLTVAAGVGAEVVRSETVQGLLTRAFGPAADEIGTALARWTSFRVATSSASLSGRRRWLTSAADPVACRLGWRIEFWAGHESHEP